MYIADICGIDAGCRHADLTKVVGRRVLRVELVDCADGLGSQHQHPGENPP